MAKKQDNRASKGRTRARVKVQAPHSGRVVITASMNNTIIAITTDKGALIAASSGGRNYKGARKATPAAAEQAAREVGEKVKNMGMVTVVAIIRGPGSGRDAAIKGLVASGLTIITIIEATPVPHNGCRARKQRRI